MTGKNKMTLEKLASMMVDGFEEARTDRAEIKRDIKDVKKDIAEIKVDVKGHGKAIDKDAVTLIDHGQRIKRLESTRS